MNIDRISSVGATVIALVALFASQFPPLYTYFQQGEIEESELADFALRCGKWGVFATAKIPYQNVGDGYATVLSMRLAIADSSGKVVAAFQDPGVQSKTKVDMLARPVFEPFVSRGIAPTEQWVASAVYQPDWSSQNIETFRILFQRLESAIEYADLSLDAEPAYDVDPEITENLSKAYEPLIRWAQKGAYSIVLETIWNDEDGERHTIQSTTSFSLDANEAAALQRYYTADNLNENPDFYNSCRIAPDLKRVSYSS
ncbi:hypothetical protein PUV47_13330 [Pseudovibrio exalbescens]|uniref:hypothetical protein n=1 Tax=Pseudovibrio exalbescens TaxID=197461 RepID=UPI0023653E12|nr:hypothetical protein [Pseudovibrio exalbescens]MDD7910904.1 hypothetical protein [Pseudovibrio exalbescens]